MAHHQAAAGHHLTYPSASAPPAPRRRSTLLAISRHWVLAVLEGTVTALLGIFLLVWPGASLAVVASVFAAYLLIHGVWRVFTAIADDGATGAAGGRALHALLGGLSILVGVLCLREPLQTLTVIALLVGAWLLFGGVLLVVSALSGPYDAGRGWAAAGGVLGVLGGVVVLLQPAISVVTLQVVVGFLLVIQGALVATGAIAIKLAGEPRMWTPPPVR